MRDGFGRWLGFGFVMFFANPVWAIERNATMKAVRGILEQSLLGLTVGQWLWLALAPIVGWIAASVLLRGLGKITGKTATDWDNILVERLQGPVRFIGAVLFERAALFMVALHPATEDAIGRATSSLLVLGVAWAVDRALDVGANEWAQRYEEAHVDPVAARAARTRVLVMRRVLGVLVMLVAAALVLTHFEWARQVGMSLLASAGIAGVVLGFAAQRSIATLLAGIQISIAQPVRIGDVVIIEGEWGTIEEITLTFVVVRIWDDRRLILPIGQLLEKPFQNWTRTSPELMGTVVVHADYAVPVEAVREEVQRVCETDPDWDGRKATLIVLDADQTTVKLRALVSAADADKLWDLRCRVREHLIHFLRTLEGGRYLPRMRIESLARLEATHAVEPISPSVPTAPLA